MTLEELERHGGIVACAELRSDKRGVEAVRDCIAIDFQGSLTEFEKWAVEFLRCGCGVAG